MLRTSLKTGDCHGGKAPPRNDNRGQEIATAEKRRLAVTLRTGDCFVPRSDIMTKDCFAAEEQERRLAMTLVLRRLLRRGEHPRRLRLVAMTTSQ